MFTSPRFSLARQLTLNSLTGLALLGLCLPAWAADGSIRAIHYDPATRHFMIDATGPVRAIVNTLNIAGHKRIIVDVENAEIATDLPRDSQLLQTLSGELPSVRNVTVNQYGGNGRPIVRILLDIDGDLQIVRLIQNQGPRLELEVNDSAAVAPPVQQESLPPVSAQPAVRPVQASPVYQPQPAQTVQQPYQPDQRDQSIAELKNMIIGMNRKYETLIQENQNLRAQQQPPAVVDNSGPLKEQINALQKSNADLQEQLASVRPRLDSLLKENQFLKTQASTPKQDPAMQAELDRLRASNNDLQLQLTKAQGQLSIISAGPSLDEMKRTLVRMNARYDDVAKQVADLQNENTRLRAQTASNAGISSSDLQALRDQVSKAQQSLGESVRTINEQNKEIAYLKNQVSNVKAGADASSREQISSLQAQLEDRNGRIRNLQQQLEEKAASQQAGAASQTEIANLKRQLDSLSKDYQETVGNLNRQLQSAKTGSDDLQRQLDDANRRLSDATRQQLGQGAKDRQIADLQKQLDDANRRLSEAGGKDRQLADLQRQLDDANRRLGSASTKDKQIADLQKQLDDANHRIQTASANNNGKSLQQIADLNRQVSELQTQLQEARRISPDQDELARLTKENDDLKCTVDSLKSIQATAQQGSTAASAETRELQSKVAYLTGQLNQAQAQISTLKKAGASTTKPVAVTGKGDVASLQKQIADLQKQLSNAKQETLSLREHTIASKGSSNPEAEQHYTQGKAYMTSNDPDKAVEEFKTALLLDQDNSRFVIDYSIALAENHEYPDAIDVLRRYLTRNPGDRDAYNQLGKIYLLNDQADAATQSFSRAISVSTLNNYATSLKKLGKNEDAEEIFKLALKLNPNDSEVLFNLGNLYNATNQLELARNNYLQALQLRPDFAEAHYNLGLIYSKMGNKNEAVNHLQKFLELSPNARNADTIRAYVEKLKA